jgi:arginyl-tRNA synthetase
MFMVWLFIDTADAPSNNGYDFNLDAMTSFEGDTGPYLQYAHARLCSIIRKAGMNMAELDSANLDLLTENHAIDLVRLLAQWPDQLLQTTRTLEPTTILTYLFRMTHMLSSSYDVLKVIGSEPEVKKARMALYEAARQVLNNGMRVLGLSPVERYVVPAEMSVCKLTFVGCEWSTSLMVVYFVAMSIKIRS